MELAVFNFGDELIKSLFLDKSYEANNKRL